jgi:hypothetical protein
MVFLTKNTPLASFEETKKSGDFHGLAYLCGGQQPCGETAGGTDFKSGRV